MRLTIISILIAMILAACTIGRKPCVHDKSLPKGHQCDEFLL